MEAIEAVMEKIRAVGPVVPGRLELQYTVCGRRGCRCADPEHPKKHGPYYRLSYNLGGRDSSLFVRREDVEAVKKMTGAYRELRALTRQLALAGLDAVKESGPSATLQQHKRIGQKGNEEDPWKAKCRAKSKTLKAERITIRDLGESRDKWKGKCLQAQQECRRLEEELAQCRRKMGERDGAADAEKKIRTGNRRCTQSATPPVPS